MKAADVKEPGFYWWSSPLDGWQVVEAKVYRVDGSMYFVANGLLRSAEHLSGSLHGPIFPPEEINHESP